MKPSKARKISGSMFEKDQLVRGRVYQILPHFGVLVRLEDGAHGFIRKRELTWDKGKVDPGKIVQVGQKIEAIVLNRDPETGSLSLSLRLVAHDPWKAVDRKYSLGTEVYGTVIGILPENGAFVEMEPGVEGFIPITQIHPEKEVREVEDILWINDRVKAVVIGIDPAQRHIHLSIKEYFDKKRRDRMAKNTPGQGVSLEEILDEKTRQHLYKIVDTGHQSKKKNIQPGNINNILVIDDNPDFGEPLLEWFQNAGYRGKLALTGAEAVEAALGHSFDLIILDSHLPDTSGIRVAERFQAEGVTAPIIMVTGYEYDQDMKRASEIGLSVWFKPFDIEDLCDILLTLEKTGELPELSDIQPGHAPQLPQPVPEQGEREVMVADNIAAVLKALREDLPVTAAALLRMNVRKQEVFLDAAAGVPGLSQEQHHNLYFSPVRDVIETGEILLENKIHERRFKYLLKWIDFASCLGVPIAAVNHGELYGLFVFHAQPDAFDANSRLRVQAAATLISAILAREQSRAQIQQAQMWILKGQLGAGILHEVHNRLGGALILSDLLDDELASLATEGDMDWGSVREYLEQISQNLHKTSDSVKLFRKLSREERWEAVDLNRAIRRTVDLLRPIANKHQVPIKIDDDPQIPILNSIGIRLEQIICNITINAIEWMTRKPEALLTITTCYDPADAAYPVTIRFRDAGPGIHFAQFETVFEMGYTTKDKGTGLGLFIARGLAESVGGRVCVAESTMFSGSTFLVELPFITDITAFNGQESRDE